MPLGLENALYSRNGTWGVLISHEMHALIGGNEEFMTALSEQHPRWAEDLSRLREYWAENQNATWLEDVVYRLMP